MRFKYFPGVASFHMPVASVNIIVRPHFRPISKRIQPKEAALRMVLKLALHELPATDPTMPLVFAS